MSENTSTTETTSPGQSEGNSHEGAGEASSNYSFDQFLNETKDIKVEPAPADDNEITTADGIPTSEQEPKVVSGDEDATEDEVVEEEVVKPAGQRTLAEIQQHRQQQKNNRKYEGLDEDETKLFKQMSQAAYDRLYPAYLESKESAKKLKELSETNKQLESRRWYEEDGAWELSPDYKSAKENIDILDFEEDYWTEQLKKVESNEEWKPLAGKPGDYKEGAAQPASIDAKVQILRKLQTIGGFKQQLSSKIEGIKENFAGRHRSFNDGLQGVHDHLFKSLDVKLPHLAPKYKEWLDKFPKEFQGQLPYQMLAKAAIVIEGLVTRLREGEALGGMKKAAKVTAKSAGPGNGKVTGGSIASNGNSAERWDKEFENITGKRLH